MAQHWPEGLMWLASMIVAGLCGFAFHRLRYGRSPCRWRRLWDKPGTRFARWQCQTCQAEAYAMDRKPPRECKRDHSHASAPPERN